MPLVSVRCQNCGAPLEVAPEARFITCGHCSGQLEFHHNSTASFTTLLEKLDRDLRDTAHDVKVLKLENELMRLDREWEEAKEAFVETDSRGNRSLPSHWSAVCTYLVTAVITVVILGFALKGGAPIYWAVLGAGCFAFFGRFLGKCQSLRAGRYERCKDLYQSRRRELTRKIQEAQRG